MVEVICYSFLFYGRITLKTNPDIEVLEIGRAIVIEQYSVKPE
ncbi:hypothetical protein [Methanolobus psychrotolerans]|nr:hypothetical protein [Methanolobus psychrotolerans]